jgi:hypothetical protein
MSQNTLVLPTTGTVSGLQQTANMNAALDTLSTLEAGPSAPSNAQTAQLWSDTTNYLVKQYGGTSWQPVWSSITGLPSNAPRGFLGGLTVTQPTSNTIAVSIGMASSESTLSGLMWNTAAFTKYVNVNWSIGTGTGALDTGTVATNTWYHVHLIGRADYYAADILISLSATAPTMPAGWTMRRRVGSVYFGASVLGAVTQLGDYFYWASAPLDVSTTALGTTSTLYTLSVPPGFKLIALLKGSVQCGSAAAVLITDPNAVDIPPSYTTVGGVSGANQGTAQATTFSLHTPTNTSQQIRARSSVAATTLSINTLGWIDFRGQYT